MHVVEETYKRAYVLLKCRVCTTSMSPPIYERILKAKNTMLGRYALESYLEQILSHGFFRADPSTVLLLRQIIISSFLNQHPGNIAIGRQFLFDELRVLMPRVVKSRDEIFSRWGYCDNHDLSRLDNQSIERDRLIGIGFVLNFVKFISFTFGDKEMISVIEAVSFMRILRLREVARMTARIALEIAPDYAFSVSLLLTPLCCDDIHDVTPRVSALAGCDRLVLPIGDVKFEISLWRGARVDVRTYLLGGAIDSSEANGIIRDPKLELENSRFTFDLVPLSYESVDVVVGENWLLRHKAEMVCHEKVVKMPWSCKVRVGSNGNLLWEASVLLGRKKGSSWTRVVFGYACGVNQCTSGFHEVNESGREDVSEFFQQRGSGAKRKLSGCGRNQMGNELILALPEGANDFVVYYDARSKDLEACLEKGRRLWVVEGLTLERCSTFGKKDKLEPSYVGTFEIFGYIGPTFLFDELRVLMPRVVKSRDEIFSRWGYCDNHDLSRLDNQSIERDRLIGIGFVLNFVKFISFTFGDKEMISVIEAIIREVFVKLLLDSFVKLSISYLVVREFDVVHRKNWLLENKDEIGIPTEKELVGFTPRHRIGFRMKFVQGATPIWHRARGVCLTSLEARGLGLMAGELQGEVVRMSKEEYESHAKMILESQKEEKMYAKFFQRRGSGAKRKLSRCERNQIEALNVNETMETVSIRIMNVSNTLSIERIKHEAKMMDGCYLVSLVLRPSTIWERQM
ncbi:hypothetical protein Tco_0006673 [Tanacetum coccineum]